MVNRLQRYWHWEPEITVFIFLDLYYQKEYRYWIARYESSA